MSVGPSLGFRLGLCESRLEPGVLFSKSGVYSIESGVDSLKPGVNSFLKCFEPFRRDHILAQCLIEIGGQFEALGFIGHLRLDKGVSHSPHADDRHVISSQPF